MKNRICFTPGCERKVSAHMPFCATHMKSHTHVAGRARWSDVSESYLVKVDCSCGNRAVGIDDTPETAEHEGRVRLNGYCHRALSEVTR